LSGAFIELLVAKRLHNSWWILVLVGGVAFKPSHINVQGGFQLKLKLSILPMHRHALISLKSSSLGYNSLIISNPRTLKSREESRRYLPNKASFVQMAEFVVNHKVKSLEVLNPFSMPWIEFVLPFNELKSFKI